MIKITCSKSSCFKDVSKDTFGKFKKVRKLENHLMGEHYLYCKDGVKYILKELKSDEQFLTTRPNGSLNYHKYTAPNVSITSYLFPIIGVELSAILSYYQGIKNQNYQCNISNSQASRQFQNLMIKHGNNFEKVLMHILKFLIKLTLISRGQDDLLSNYIPNNNDSSQSISASKKINFSSQKQPNKEKISNLPIIIDCIRVQNGQLFYCYDTWMYSQFQIVLKDIRELQNFFFCQQELNRIEKQYQKWFNNNKKGEQQHKQSAEQLQQYQFTSSSFEAISLFSAFYKVFLSILFISTSQLNLRLYEWGEFKIGQQNVHKRLNHFKLKFNNPKTKLFNIMEKVLLIKDKNEEQLKMSDIFDIFMQDQKSSQQARSSICNSQMKSSALKAPQRVTLTKKKKMQSSVCQDENVQPENSRFSVGQFSNVKITTEFKNKNMYQSSSSSKLNQNLICFSDKINNCENNRPLREKNISNYQLNSQSFVFTQSSNKKKIPTKLSIKNKLFGNKLCSIITQKLKTTMFDQNRLNISLLKVFNLDHYETLNDLEQKVMKYLQKIIASKKWQYKQYKDGGSYFGQLKQLTQNQYHIARSGLGVYLYPFGDLYIGNWSNNQINDFGIYLFKTGQTYIGQLKNGSKQGFGTFYYSQNKKYEGFWSNDQKIGLGTVLFSSSFQPNLKVKFIGDFNPTKNDNEIEGIFTCYQQSNKLWSQEGFLNNFDPQSFKFKHLNSKNDYHKKFQRSQIINKCSAKKYGEINDQNGSKYVGEIVDTKRNGFGIEENEAYRYEGGFVNNKRQGKGKIIFERKFIIEGEWKDGIMIKYERK